MLPLLRIFGGRLCCCKIDILPKQRLRLVTSNYCFPLVYRVSSNMPPKRKAAAAKSKPAEKEPDVDAGDDQLQPPAPKTRKGRSKTEVKEPETENNAVQKNVRKGRGKEIDKPEKEETAAKKSTKDKEKKVSKRGAPVKGEDPPDEKPAKKGKKKAEKPAEEKPKTTTAPANSTTTNWEALDFTCTKKNAEGKKPNLKISSWNIGGIKSWVKKGCIEFLQYEEPDIFCVQESKCNEENLPDEIKNLENYEQYSCASRKDGYAGVCLFSKKKPLKVTYGINEPEQDKDGRCITAEYEEYYVVCVYVPNAGRKLVTLPKRLEWNEAFKKYIKSFDKKKPVIICGDMNVAHNEIDLARPQNNTKNAGFTPEEREGMTDFLEDGYVDTYRKLYPDQTDVYTFWTYMMNARAKNVGWRLDYFIVSERIMNKVCDNVVRTDVLGSDHCPITLFINI